MGDEALQHTIRTLTHLSMVEGWCDITFRDSPPLLGVRMSPALNAALMYGAGAKKIHEMLQRLETRGGHTFSAFDVWVVVPLPGGVPTEAELAAVDLADGEAEVVPGVTMRQMAREIYHCRDDAEAEKMLRRILAA